MTAAERRLEAARAEYLACQYLPMKHPARIAARTEMRLAGVALGDERDSQR